MHRVKPLRADALGKAPGEEYLLVSPETGLMARERRGGRRFGRSDNDPPPFPDPTLWAITK